MLWLNLEHSSIPTIFSDICSMRSLYVIACFIFVMSSCVETAPQPHIESPQPNSTKKNIDDQLGDIYQNYTTDPKSQFQKDENLIIDYIALHQLDAKRAENGLYYIIHEKGTGPLLQRGSPVKADYKGYFLDGQIFDSSYKRKKPIRFTVGQMAPGWDQGMSYVSRGAKLTLILPSFLGYGEEGFQNHVPPNSVILFDIDIKKEAY